MTQYFDPFTQGEDSSGAPIAGALLQFFETGTTTPKNTFTNSGFGTPNANPVVADGFGRFGPIFLNVSGGLYTVILKDADGVVIKSQDGFGGADDGLAAGDVNGPASSTDNAIARFNSTTGKLLQNSTTTLDDNGSIVPAGFMGSRKGSNIADSATPAIPTNGDYFEYAGTTTTTALTVASNRAFTLKCTGIRTFTASASIVTEDGNDITTTAGDVLMFQSTATDVVQVTKAPSATTGITLGTLQATTSGNSFNFGPLPSGRKRIFVNFNGTSVDDANDVLVRLGDSDGIEATGYTGSTVQNTGASGLSTSFNIKLGAAANTINGTLILTLMDASTNLWACSSSMGSESGSHWFVIGGNKSLSAELNQIEISSVGDFDGGSINITDE